MVSAPSFSGLGALVVCAFVFATVVRCPGGLLAAGNFAVAAVLESASGSCWARVIGTRSEEHTSELQSRGHLVCRLLLEKKKEMKRRIVFSWTAQLVDHGP